MAKLYPCIPPAAVERHGGFFREMDVLARLQQSLPDEYEVYHNVDWYTLQEDTDRHGEIDIIVMNQAGHILLMEVKAGQVEFRSDGVFKRYGISEVQVDRQCNMQYGVMRNLLDRAGISTFLRNCLVLPDCRVLDAEIVGMPRQRIFDAGEFDVIGMKVIQLLPPSQHRSEAEAVRRFLLNEMRIAPDVSVLNLQIKDVTLRLADGLATWVPRIEAPSGIVRIQATAGSGKTQLALRLLEESVRERRRALYVCFNRPLADHIARLAPVRARISTFHELCIDHHRRHHGEPDFSTVDIFERAAAFYLESVSGVEPELDLLIIDEAQDFEPEWVAGLVEQLRPDGRLYLLEDESQRLYSRDAYDLKEAVVLRCDDNFRSPRLICQAINAFGLADRTLQAKNPYQGQLPDFFVSSGDDFERQTANAVDRLMEKGFTANKIVILSLRGHGKSSLLSRDRIGAHSLRRFSGRYSRNGDPIWTEGELLIESVYRFKGQSSPAIVLTEIDFEAMTEFERRRLFVGMTRAQMSLSIVLTDRAEKVLAMMLQ